MNKCECQMPGCKEPGEVQYNGTTFCQDCYEKEKARMDMMYEDMID